MRSGVTLLAGILGIAPAASAQTFWQSDLQIRRLAVSEITDRLTARVVGSAYAVRLELPLPVGVGLLGDLSPRSSREIHVVTTVPAPYIKYHYSHPTI